MIGRFGTLAAALTLAGPAAAATLVGWETDDRATIPATGAAPGLTASDLTRGPGIAPDGGNNYNSSGWTTSASAAVGFAMGDWYAFDLTFEAPTILPGINVYLDRNSKGPMLAQMWASFDGGAYDAVGPEWEVDNGGDAYGLDLTGEGPVTTASFRLIGYCAEDEARGEMDIRDRVFGGSARWGLVVEDAQTTPGIASPLDCGGPGGGGLPGGGLPGGGLTGGGGPTPVPLPATALLLATALLTLRRRR